MVSPQRALSKLCEFLPHQQGSTCIQIGKKSGRILVTAGNQTINLWTVGNIASPVLRLPDQPTAVGTLTFDSQEELLAATFQNGVIKVWDLEEAKVVRTLEFFDKELPSLYPTTVAFHPCRSIVAYFLADGSAQVYDLKACRVLQTHHPFSHLSQESNKTTSHSFSSGLIQFSPDGRWLCTAVNSLQTKYHKIHIWDLVASKCIAELQTTGNSPINNVHFNPIDFVLALGTVSGTVELWDLDTFKLSASFPETSSLRTLSFAPDGNVLFALHSSYIKTYRWPPTADQKMNETTIPITEGDGWKDVVDMAAVSRTHHFVVAALPNPNVILWTIDTKKLCAVGDDVVDGVVTKDTDVVEASLQDDHCISEVSNELSREAKRSTPQPDIKQLSEDALAEVLLWRLHKFCRYFVFCIY
jgi:WD40 repeat protein